MEPTFRLFDSPLPGLEAEYRQRFLRADVIQATAAIVAWNVLSVLSVRSDYLFFGAGPQFFVHLGGRLALVALGVLAVLALNRTNSPPAYDRIVAAKLAGVALFTLYVDISRPPDYFAHIPLDVLLILAIYLAVPAPPIVRVGAASFFTLGSALVLFAKTASPAAGLARSAAAGASIPATVLAFAAANLLGLLVSAHLYSQRRRQFTSDLELKGTGEELRRLATTDSLTGVANRRDLIQRGSDEFGRSRRYGRPFSILIMDIDNFKKINDAYGQAAGDEVLRQFARMVMDRKRKQDTFGRLGGEEFALLLPETRLADAAIVGERLRLMCSETAFGAEGSQACITLSMGLVERTDADASFDTLQKRADDMLYKAKQNGYNRLIWA